MSVPYQGGGKGKGKGKGSAEGRDLVALSVATGFLISEHAGGALAREARLVHERDAAREEFRLLGGVAQEEFSRFRAVVVDAQGRNERLLTELLAADDERIRAENDRIHAENERDELEAQLASVTGHFRLPAARPSDDEEDARRRFIERMGRR